MVRNSKNGINSQTSSIERNKRRIWYTEYLGLSLNALGMHNISAEEGAAENIIERTMKRQMKNIISFVGWITWCNNKKKIQNEKNNGATATNTAWRKLIPLLLLTVTLPENSYTLYPGRSSDFILSKRFTRSTGVLVIRHIKRWNNSWMMMPTTINPITIFLKVPGIYFKSKYDTTIENNKKPMIIGISSNIYFQINR